MPEENQQQQQPTGQPANNDLEIQNSALKELLAENKATMDSLRSELDNVKKTNAKLLAQLNVEPPKPSLEENLMLFDKYSKKGK